MGRPDPSLGADHTRHHGAVLVRQAGQAATHRSREEQLLAWVVVTASASLFQRGVDADELGRRVVAGAVAHEVALVLAVPAADARVGAGDHDGGGVARATHGTDCVHVVAAVVGLVLGAVQQSHRARPHVGVLSRHGGQ